jgi:uncharacterized cofD-like protein
MKKVVTIGGGTGSFMLLSGLKKYPIELSAIVSMADDGGSTGVLRDELGVLPPGDVRQCLVALSDAGDVMRELMNYRFEEGSLGGHSFGNLLLSALEKIEGGFLAGVQEAAKILNVRGEVVPVTGDDTGLCVELEDGEIIKGEHAINTHECVREKGIKRAYLEPTAKANTVAVQKILEADMVIIGPGNHYCSIVPNLLVQGISEALQNTKALVVYNANLVNKREHSSNFTLETYVEEIESYIGAKRIDYVVFNNEAPPQELVEKYKEEGGLLERSAEEKERRYKIIQTNVLSKEVAQKQPGDSLAVRRNFIRHDTEKLAKILMMLLELKEYEQIINDIQ